MILIALAFAFFISLLLTLAFYFIFKVRGPWKGYWVFFLIMFLVSFAAGEWIIPAGPVAWGYYWLPALLTAILVAILIASTTSPRKRNEISKIKNEDGVISPTAPHASSHESEEEPREGLAIGTIVWIFLLLLLIWGIVGYLYT